MTLRDEAIKLHLDNNGKIKVVSKVPIENRHDLSLAYTPGVAEPCKDIKEDKNLSFEYTCRGNMIAVVSDGTRVLGLGDIGPEAGIPVMEGKAALFKTFADVDAVPVCLGTKDPDEIVKTVKYLEPNYAGINLEDISSPKCYDIEDRLKEICDIPVFHDDQHGTAIACLSAVMGALRFVKKDFQTAKFVVNGCGAAGSAIGRLLVNMGAQNVIMVDRWGALYEGIDVQLDRIQTYLATVTNKDKVQGVLADVAKGADVLIGVSAPNVFTKEIMQSMAKDAVVFALANPVPETTYDLAKEAGVAVAGTGRSDRPNQVNNVTVFPGVFRGAIDVRARAITEDMKVAAVWAIVDLIDEKDLREDYVVPDAFDPRVAPAVAAAVAKVAIEKGLARKIVDPEEVKANTLKRVGR
ncbi:MAG: NADP-dependent malic enzyme [Phascolarctobacterium sp.]|nr:NADP-dependent malic enzyme [Phascolarctobacterium sp.]MBQ2975427.1 NADP-dependent malic enzyme [Phascolarctobacterium sp.]MBQ3541286.1 NADP-dependent malic enzyme [Phascolarctobacterium sp.]MBQ8690334.1 NADP-dependent malic enzyme [Phascolarctobacterium sp.]MBR2039216.1 NADP-dependent malic enzyme [Phascolarctobacterium sp.]